MTQPARMRADEVIQALHLAPLPVEGGFFAQTYQAEAQIPKALLGAQYPQDKSLCTAIYYLRTAGPDSFSALHRLPTAEIYHYYLGDPVEMLLLYPGGEGEVVVLGPDLAAGQHPQLIVPADVWQGGRVLPGGEWNLCGTTMAPGFDPSDYAGGDRDELIAAYPAFAGFIRALTRLESPSQMSA